MACTGRVLPLCWDEALPEGKAEGEVEALVGWRPRSTGLAPRPGLSFGGSSSHGVSVHDSLSGPVLHCRLALW
jgi:hypothetical protein